MMAKPAIAGLFAALPTPLRGGGGLDLATFDRIVDFVIEAGVDGVCVGGATSEYPHIEVPDRIAVIRRAAARLPTGRVLLAGIGAPSIAHVLEIGRAAFEAGSRAVLLPMPFFFNYQQDDLQAYCAHVSRALAAPCLLYDLPLFTTALASGTAVALMRDEDFIVGIKDSSGSEDNLATFADARGDRGWTLLAGDDRLLHRGLQAGWNGGISGIAAFCPELLCAIWRAFNEGGPEEAARSQALVDELAGHVLTLPTPWAIRIALAARGIDTGPLPLPLSARRQEQIGRFKQWFGEWMAIVNSEL